MRLQQSAVDVWETSGPTGVTPVLCLDGILGRSRIFSPFAELCAPSRTVVLADLPPGDPWRAAALLARRLEGRAPMHVLTGSYGGLVARKLPNHLVASVSCIGTLPHSRFVARDMKLQVAALRRMPARVVEPLYHRRSRSALVDDGVPSALVDELTGTPLDADVLLGRLTAVTDHDLPELNPDWPVLWLHGADDPQITWTEADVRAEHPNAQVATVPGGHHPHASHPGPLLERVQAFWDSLGPTD